MPMADTSLEHTNVRMHAAHRWACAVVAATGSERDPKSLRLWGHVVGAATGTLRTWCRAAGVSPRASLYFCRMLRAVVLSRSEGWEPQNLLDIVDERTLKAFLLRCGADSQQPTIEGFLVTQPLITDPKNVNAVRVVLLQTGVLIGDSREGRSQASDGLTAEREGRDSHSAGSKHWWVKRGA
jgi:hypothetical protein